MSIIIYGPRGCGKTLNAPALATFFGCDKIIEEWDERVALPERGALILTNRASPSHESIRVMSFEAACRLANITKPLP